MNRSIACLVSCLLLLAAVDLRGAPPSTRMTEGLRDKTPTHHALTKVRAVTRPGTVVEQATIVLRDGVIVSVTEQGPVPAGAREWNLDGCTVYAGFIDAYTEETIDHSVVQGGAPHSNPLILSQLDLAKHLRSNPGQNQKMRSQGITMRLAVPAGGIMKGQSCLVTTADDAGAETIFRSRVAQHMQLTVPRTPRRDGYPNSPMGALTLARQTLLDAQWYPSAWKSYRANENLPRPEQNDALEALDGSLQSQQLFVIDAGNDLYFLRADRIAKEFGLPAIIRGSGREYRRIDQIAATGRSVIVPLSFPKPPFVGTVEAAQHASLEELLHWDIAPENPSRLDKAGVRISLTTHGLKEPQEFLPAIRKAVARGLSPESALRALTVHPATMFGVADRCGSIEPGKIANLVITDGDLFAPKTRILATWIHGQRHEVEKPASFDARGTWQLTWKDKPDQAALWITLQGDKPGDLRGEISTTNPTAPDPTSPKTETAASSETPSAKEPPASKKTGLDQILQRDMRLTALIDTAVIGKSGRARLVLVAPSSESNQDAWDAEWVDADEQRHRLLAKRFPAAATAKPPAAPQPQADASKQKELAGQPAQPSTTPATASASFPVMRPFGAYGRNAYPAEEPLVVFQNATIWTSGPAGNLENASLIVAQGKIQAVGKDLAIPPNAKVIDCRGKFLSPGIIDCHSHMATDGGVNESGRAITSQVRIGDFIDDTDISVYRQLAGGVTAAHILHGSANPIGGQSQVIKLRWGASPEAMKMAEAPPTIKFALGENVKQSNWGERATSRYPQTRMGVEQLFRDEFLAAREYRDRWKDWERNHEGIPPRRDLELEAIVEVLEGRRLVHCHSYRQDEILALLRVAEEFHFTIACLQHILEGYKVADAIARHGAGGSSFSDWWAYKFEVIDSIPHNGALMHRAGVVVSFNSDDRELARHLNQEAAKAVHYGGVSPVEAFKFVTLNPARQLHIDKFVGSLETGKDADLVVWNAPPLSNFARPEQTWVDGRRMFDSKEDRELRAGIRTMRLALVQKVLDSREPMRETGSAAGGEQEDWWPREDEFCHDHPH